MASLQAAPSALPEFSDEDSWYYYVRWNTVVQIFLKLTDIFIYYRLGFALTHGLYAMLSSFVPFKLPGLDVVAGMGGSHFSSNPDIKKFVHTYTFCTFWL